MTRPSPWGSPFARRTYAAGILWAAGVIAARITETPDHAGWLAFRLDLPGLLYVAAALVGGWNFVGAGVRSLRTLKLDMNFLMSAAIVGAILIGEPFEAATLAFLFSLAELLERFAVDRGRRSIARLVELAPERADRLLPDGSVEAVSVAGLRPGDRVRIRPGDKVPADGRVVAGSSAVNEATITGESLPRHKEVGARHPAAASGREWMARKSWSGPRRSSGRARPRDGRDRNPGRCSSSCARVTGGKGSSPSRTK